MQAYHVVQIGKSLRLDVSPAPAIHRWIRWSMEGVSDLSIRKTPIAQSMKNL